MILVSVYDKKADTYAPCYCIANKHIAIRSFENLVKNGDSDVSKFPEDFALMEVGSFAEDTGIVENIVPNILVNATDFIMKKEDERHSRRHFEKRNKK